MDRWSIGGRALRTKGPSHGRRHERQRAPARRADDAADGDRITAVGTIDATEAAIDSERRLVTPGFADMHPHLDVRVGWDPIISSRCWHGITLVVTDTCGATSVPVRPGQAEGLASVMESVEDIPASCILDGLPKFDHIQRPGFLRQTPAGSSRGG